MKLHQLIAIGAATVFAGVVGAQTPPVSQPTQPTTPSSSPSTGSESMGSSASAGGFDKLDKDRDGSISKKEAASNKDLTKKWDTLDTNKDGKLDQGEFAQFEASGSASPSEGASPSGSTTTKPAEKPKY
jgi:hypothetical protein